jgi:hypothetical protein
MIFTRKSFQVTERSMCSWACSTLHYISGIVISHYKGHTAESRKAELAGKFVNYGT